uniref:Uncharacterized protein n=1 Tax=Ditylenchus dipsaci TaxID=166011 RepID=A0A915D4C2_9BILA
MRKGKAMGGLPRLQAAKILIEENAHHCLLNIELVEGEKRMSPTPYQQPNLTVDTPASKHCG